uniref:hypothetical protein n=1 Tax=Frankia gtarii TaxID=2950102 RepID=UPI0021BFD08D
MNRGILRLHARLRLWHDRLWLEGIWREGTGDDTGSISLFLLGAVATAAILFAALITDQTRILHANGAAFDLAGKAARVGAQQLDTAALDDGVIRLDPAGARTAARAYLTAHDVDNPEIAVAGATVTVTVHQQVRFRIPVLATGPGATVTQTRPRPRPDQRRRDGAVGGPRDRAAAVRPGRSPAGRGPRGRG